ncbi:MAG: prolyl oligopeptidase family serine peptidase [Acidobacteriota bacterium]|nr:prolyl oligopeptidase family serine peptidase [Acidobacteriota bacterium]
MPQYRGSSGGGQDYALALRGDLGGGDVRDIEAGLAELRRRGLVDLERAAVAGASYGGYLVNWMLATTDHFRAGISIAGIFDLAQDYATSAYSSWEEHYLGGAPWQQAALYQQRSPLYRADGITAPILILHGWEDDNTYFTNAKALHRALVALGRTTELVLYPREGHGLAEPRHRLDALLRIEEWLARHVLGVAGPHVPGREVAGDPVTLLPLGHRLREEYAGVRPPEGKIFLEISLQIAAREPGPEFLRLVPSGGGSDIVLVDEKGALLRPIGVPLEVQGASVLFWGRGALEAWAGEQHQPPVLPVSVVFEIPEENHRWQLKVSDLPAIPLEIHGAPDEDGG